MISLVSKEKLKISAEGISSINIVSFSLKRYLKDPKTIILCVVSAMQDLMTSDTLQMAFEEDPEGVRTIGVITKVNFHIKNSFSFFNRLTLWTKEQMQKRYY